MNLDLRNFDALISNCKPIFYMLKIILRVTFPFLITKPMLNQIRVFFIEKVLAYVEHIYFTVTVTYILLTRFKKISCGVSELFSCYLASLKKQHH